MADKKTPKKSGGADLDENGYDNNPDAYLGITRITTGPDGEQMSHTIGQDEIDIFKKQKAAAKKKSKLKKLYPTQDTDSSESP